MIINMISIGRGVYPEIFWGGFGVEIFSQKNPSKWKKFSEEVGVSTPNPSGYAPE